MTKTNGELDEIKCIVCNKGIKRGEPGTCMHETGFDHHLKCSFAPETEQAIQAIIDKKVLEGRIDELNWLPNDFAGVREYVANRRLELQATNPEESNHEHT